VTSHVPEAFERALRDLQGADPIELVVEYEDDRPVVREAGDGEKTILWIPPDADLEDLVSSLAFQLQEQVFPETRAAWGQARPPCPGHAHPAIPELVGDDAMWVCPSSGQPLARIGSLHQEERECP
jgi:hypothetical protein